MACLRISFCVLAFTSVCVLANDEDEIDLEPIEYTQMEWQARNIVVMVVGIALCLSIVLTLIFMAVCKPHEQHVGKVFNDDGTIDANATQKKRMSLGKRPSFFKRRSTLKSIDIDIIDEEEEAKEVRKKLKKDLSRDRRRSILDKSKKASQHLPEMTEEDREVTKSNIKRAALLRKSSNLSFTGKSNGSNALNV